MATITAPPLLSIPTYEPSGSIPSPISYKPLHRTFGAEASGVDFQHVNSDTVDQIKAGLAKYGVLVFRKTGLDDARHVEMSQLFGDLDDIAPFVQGLGQKNRLSSD